jgi:hypothetical protein
MEHDTKHGEAMELFKLQLSFVFCSFSKRKSKRVIERDQGTHVNLVHTTRCYASNVNPSGVFHTFPSYDKLNAHVVDIELLGFQLCRWMCPHSNPTQPNPAQPLSPKRKGENRVGWRTRSLKGEHFTQSFSNFSLEQNLEVQYYEMGG